MQRHFFFFTLHPLSTVIFATATVLAFVMLRHSRFNFHCYTQPEATPTQKSARKWRCDLSRLLAQKITKGIHSCKPASLNRPIGCPKMHFFPWIRDLLVSQKTTQRHFFPLSIPWYFLQLQQWWHLYWFAILGSTSIVTHSVKQRLLRNQPGSDAATSCDFLRKRLQRAFTRTNQLHWTAQYLVVYSHVRRELP